MYQMKQMINADKIQVEAFLNARKDTTLFALGNIEQYGLEGDYRCYAWFCDKQLVACVCIFLEKYITAVLVDDADSELRGEIRTFIESNPHEDFAAFDMYFDTLNVEHLYTTISEKRIAKTDPHFLLDIQEISNVSFHILSEDSKDVEILAQLIAQIEGFDRHDIEDNKMMYQRATPPTGWTIYAKFDGEIVASATVTGISETTAVVTSVWVLQNARQKGIASQLIQRIQEQFVNSKRTLYIMYSNPKAAHIYLNNGFIEYGRGYIAEQ
ncbi:MAG: GNAT family N-acetyltransferase [Culicoidibacterales bacterium]